MIERGAFDIKHLRRSPKVDFYPWNPIPASPPAQKPRRGTPRDRMKLAHEYQKIMDSGVAETRAELARHLGVSRARVTQVLNRLKEA